MFGRQVSHHSYIVRRSALHATGFSRKFSRGSKRLALRELAPHLDLKYVRNNESRVRQDCLDRNNQDQAGNAARIVKLWGEWCSKSTRALDLKRKRKELDRQFQTAIESGDDVKAGILADAKSVKDELSVAEREVKEMHNQIQELAFEIPNTISDETPRGTVPGHKGYLNENVASRLLASDVLQRDHVKLGAEFDLFDFASAAKTSGWGWYFLKNEAAMLEQALIQYAISVAIRHGFSLLSPPSMVYSHIAAGCGFRPRDRNGEQQVFNIQQTKRNIETDAPSSSLTGTAEIPFAGMMAKGCMNHRELPRRVVGSSRCYRAEAGARGAQTRGLYRVHEFTKVEMFAWTTSEKASPNGDVATFNVMLEIQKEILRSLGLCCRILEMPSADLGASAARKQDIEAYFPSRALAGIDAGWGEVTSTSLCTDYQSRRLHTVAMDEGKGRYPHTVNGTALAVPRVLAALLEYGWSPEDDAIRIPEVLWPWMHGVRRIRRP